MGSYFLDLLYDQNFEIDLNNWFAIRTLDIPKVNNGYIKLLEFGDKTGTRTRLRLKNVPEPIKDFP